MAHQSSLPVWDRNYSPEPAEGAEVLKVSDRISLTFANAELLQQHVQEDAEQILTTINRMKTEFTKLADKWANTSEQNRNHRKERTTYLQANDQLMIENAQLEGEVVALRQQLEEAIKAGQSDDGSEKGISIRNDSHNFHSTYSRSIHPPASQHQAPLMHAHPTQRSAKLPDPEVLTGNNIEIDAWIGKMKRKLRANADHWPTEEMRIAYVETRVSGKAHVHIDARLRDDAIKPFLKAEEMLDVLYKAYGDPNRKQTAMTKFRSLIMTKDFNSFWADFQALATVIEYSEATLIQELRTKLTPALSQAMLGVRKSTDLHEYAAQCEETYQDLKEFQTRVGIKADGFAKHRGVVNKRKSFELPTSSLYAKPAVTSRSSTTFQARRSDEVRLTPDELARLRKEDRCFRCKEVGDHRPRCEKEWRPMSVLPASVNQLAVHEVTVPTSGHISENI